MQIVEKNNKKQVLNIDQLSLKDQLKIEASTKLIFSKLSNNTVVLEITPKTEFLDLEIVIPENTDLKITENFNNKIDFSSFTYNLSVQLGENSNLIFQSYENINSQIKLQAKKIFELGRLANLSYLGTQFGSKENIQYIESFLESEAISNLSILTFLSENQVGELVTRNVFFARNGGGEIKIKAVAKDNSQAKIEGMIKIGEKAGKTNTYLKQDVIMLGEKSKINAIPSLEIDTNDVKASHGVSVSKISDLDLFYLKSRGIEKKQAESLIIEGFLNELLEENIDSNFRETVLKSIREKQISN